MYGKSGFSFDGIEGGAYNLELVRLDKGLIESQFGMTRKLRTDSTIDGNKTYSYGTTKENLSFDIILGQVDENAEWDSNTRIEIARWLFQDDYKPLRLEDYPDMEFYVLIESAGKRMGWEQGYIELTVTCNAPYGYATPQILEYDFSGETTTQTIEIFNTSNTDIYYYPEIEFELAGSTSFSIKNLSDESRFSEFTNLTDGESIYVNNDRKKIVSSIDGNIRYANFNKKWIRLKQGLNILEISPKCALTIRTQYPIIL